MIEIKEGPDLDRAVAEAIGLTCTGNARFRPSTVLKDAFTAEDLAGLFNNYRVLRKNRHHWEVYEIGESLDRVVSSGETPALAICAAILKVKTLEPS